MSRTVTALFDSRPDAEAAKARLTASSVDADRIRIIDKESCTAGDGSSGDADDRGFWASLKDLFMPDEDRQAYGEGINRGAFLLCAQVDEGDADKAIGILDQESTVDFDKRQDEWRSSGWSGYTPDAGSGLFGSESTTGTGATAGAQTGGLATGTTGMPLTGASTGFGTGGLQEDEPRFGTRETNRGGPRVRSYMPGQEQGRSGDRSAFGGFGSDDSKPQGGSERERSEFERTDRDKSF